MQKTYLTYLTSSIISNGQILIERRENVFCKFHIFFGFVYNDLKQKNKIRCIDSIDAPKYAFTHRNLKVYMNYLKCTWKVSILLY